MRRAILVALWTAAGCGTPQIVVSPPLAVVNFAPHDGATGVDPAATEAVCFNQEVDAGDAAGKITVLDDTGAEAAAIELKNARTTGDADPFCVAVGHAALKSDAAYRIRVSKGLAAKSGDALATDITSRFRTARQ